MLSGALRQASADTAIQAEYTQNLIPLIYGNEAPEFAVAFDSFNTVAVSLIATLKSATVIFNTMEVPADFMSESDRTQGEQTRDPFGDATQ